MNTNKTENEDVLLIEGSLFEREFFGVKRHNLISGTAERLLQSERAKERITTLLDPLFETMADVGGWADEIKQNPPNDVFTTRFLADPRNKSHRTWHYVNLPLDAVGYSRTEYPEFTGETDVVQIARQSVLVLKGESDRFEEITALRLLSHLIGDIHQPIHIGCGYIDDSTNPPKLVFDPEIIRQKNLESDRGGNSLLLPIGNSVSLHSYWDSRLGGNVTDIIPSNDNQLDENSLKSKAIEKLFKIIDAEPMGDTSDQAATFDQVALEDHPAVWASEAVKTARQAYQSLKIETLNGNKFKVSWEGKENYDTRCTPIIITQMTKAAQNLAFLLDSIWS